MSYYIGLPLLESVSPKTVSLPEPQGKMPSSNYLLLLFSSLYLFKLGLAPQIQDLYGKVDFTGKKTPTLMYAAFISYPSRSVIERLFKSVKGLLLLISLM